MATIFNGEEEIEVSETNNIYLSELSLTAANEIRNYAKGADSKFKATKELTTILEKHILKSPKILSSNFPHYALYNALNKDEKFREEYSNLAEFPYNMGILIENLKVIKTFSREDKNEIADLLDDFSVTLEPSAGNFFFRTGKEAYFNSKKEAA